MKKLVLLMAMLVGLSTPSFAGSVGETDTSCIKNQSTQSRDAKEVVETEAESKEVSNPASKDQ
jgi:hypothetical protein